MQSDSQFHILLYHGVYPDEIELGARNSSGKHIARSRFEREMTHLAQNRPLVSMRQIAAALNGGAALPPEAVAVTFDDGFYNNFAVAWPILERLKIPMTLYTATGFIGTGRMIWSDRLEAALLGSTKQGLDIRVAGHRLNYELSNEQERVDAFLEIKALCKAAKNEIKDQIVEAVFEAMDAEVDAEHPLYTFMNWDQARQMDASPLIDLGAHTVDHVSLANVDPADMRQQIDASVAAMQTELGRDIDLFSYPEGQERDYNKEVVDYLRSKGFDHAPSAIEGVNDSKTTSPFDLLRIMVGFEGRPYPFV
jgi:peptidoglycan/xylan/chitin deacetylase (PgdA/CDA1 family)